MFFSQLLSISCREHVFGTNWINFFFPQLLSISCREQEMIMIRVLGQHTEVILKCWLTVFKCTSFNSSSLADRICLFCKGCILMVGITTFNNISVILGRSDLLVKKTRVAGKNH
jgi:hypothetical protein